MHELGVVFHIIKKVDKIASENNVKSVLSLTLEIGEVSMIVPTYFKDCFDWAKVNRSKFMHECNLNIIEIKAKTLCTSCNKEYETVRYGRICPYCNSEKTYLVCGNEVLIKEIEVN